MDGTISPDSDGGVVSSDARLDDGGSIIGADARPDDEQGDGGMDPMPDLDGPNQLIRDRHFSLGFVAKDQVSGNTVGTMNPGFAPGETIWNLGQWGSLTTLSDATPTTLSSGSVEWKDLYGAVTIGAPDSSEPDLSLRVNAHAEYNGVYFNGPNSIRTTWVHLLGEQRISEPYAEDPACPPLSELSALHFSADSRLLVDERNLQGGFDPGRHAASYLMFFTIQNLAEPGTPGFGDYLWFGLTLYDDRDSYPGLFSMGDAATGKLIYNIGLAPLTSSSLNDNQWHSLDEDLLPHIRLALQEAWDKGFLPDSHVLSDYRIGGMNLGWEIPGLNNAELQLDDLSLTYDKRPVQEIRFDFNNDGNSEGWTAANAQVSGGSPSGGLWEITVPGNDPAVTSPELRLDAASYSSLSVTVANDGNPAAASIMQVFWTRFGSPNFAEANSASVAISNDGSLTTYTFDLSLSPGWTGEIDTLRIDPVLSGNGNTVRFDSVVFTP